eukprot:8247640-Pyramimonas_sp.AAC.1
MGSSPLSLSLPSCSQNHARSASRIFGNTAARAHERTACRLAFGPASAASARWSGGADTPYVCATAAASCNQVPPLAASAARIAGATGESCGRRSTRAHAVMIRVATLAAALVSRRVSRKARTWPPAPRDADGGRPSSALATS